MTDDAGSYTSGVGGGGPGGGGNDWELVSLTASTYAAAPGPILPLLLDAHKKTELPPAAAVNSAIFMSQHFSFPAAEAHTNTLNGCQEEEEEESAPDTLPPDDEGATDNLNIPCVREQDGGSITRSSDFHKDLSTTLGLDDRNLFADAGNDLPVQGRGGVPVCVAVHHHVSVVSDAATDGTMDSSSEPTHVVQVGSGAACVAPNKGLSSRIPCEAQAWWNKTFKFLRSNSNESLTFRFIFVAATIVGFAILGQRGKLQLRLEFNVDSEKISCGSEPLALGQVKVGMLGGSHVAQGQLTSQGACKKYVTMGRGFADVEIR